MLTLGLMLALAEAGSYLLGKYYIPRSALSFTLYDPHYRPKAAEIERYFAQRDSVLGWPPRDAYGGELYDRRGARPLPAFPDADADACVSLYGDSYTYSSYVGPADAWGNLLAGHLGCRVANYGVSGYGTDQALLRFVRGDEDGSGIVILGIATVDIIRLVNQDRRLIWNSRSGPLLKPRYALGADGRLRLIELPAVTAADLDEYARHPERYLHHEWFLPDTPDGPVTLRVPYSISLVRGLMLPRVWNKLAGKPSWIEFYDARHGSGALPLLVGICREFVRVAEERGKRPLIVVIPTSQDLWHARDTGSNPSAPLLDALRRQSIEPIDVLPAMLRHVGDRDVCEIFGEKTWLGYCWGHYTPEGERVIATSVQENLGPANAMSWTGAEAAER